MSHSDDNPKGERHIKRRYNLKFWRMRQGLTQAEVAKKIGISAGHYKAIENGIYNPSEKILLKFGQAFNMDQIFDVADLFSN